MEKSDDKISSFVKYPIKSGTKKQTEIIDVTKHPNPQELRKRYDEIKKHKKVVLTTGYFDPLHHGHIELFKLSKELGDYLIVGINNDDQTKAKKGFVFMTHEEKAKIISEFECVDEVFISIGCDQWRSQNATLEFIRPHIFAKGGDRTVGNIPETPTCVKHGIKIVEGVGSKVQSSSDLIKFANEAEEKIRLKKEQKELEEQKLKDEIYSRNLKEVGEEGLNLN